MVIQQNLKDKCENLWELDCMKVFPATPGINSLKCDFRLVFTLGPTLFLSQEGTKIIPCKLKKKTVSKVP